MTANSTVALELDDIQAGALSRGRFLTRVYTRSCVLTTGMQVASWRLIPYLNSVASFDPKMPVSLAVALSFQGLALGVPEESLASPHPSSSREWPHARPSLGT